MDFVPFRCHRSKLSTEALDHNRSLAASLVSTLARAKNLRAGASGLTVPASGPLLPQSGRQQYGKEFLGPIGIPPFTYFAVGPTVSYALDYNGGVKRGVEQQYALAEVEQHQRDAAYLTVTGRT